MTQNEPIFVVLEGGGAKGVAHIGALQALDEMGYKIVGIAGASAGALVAALYALGLSPREIIDTKKQRHVLDDIGVRDATEILGWGWKWIKIARCFVSPIGRSLITLFFGAILIAVLLVDEHRWFVLLVPAFFALVGLLIFRSLRGLASLDQFVCCFDKLARQKIEDRLSERVCFGDFGPGNNGRPVLKIVATNITNGTMELFSPDRTPDIPISEAVAASICIPFIFRPRIIGSSACRDKFNSFLDGGLVSNLPGWVFDDDRVIHSRARTILIELVSEEEIQRKESLFQFLGQTIRTALFGAHELNVRGIERKMTVPLPVPDKWLRWLEFDADLCAIGRVVEQARLATKARFGRENQLRETLDDLGNRCWNILSRPLEGKGQAIDIGNVRVSMALLRQWEVDRIKSKARHNLILRISHWSDSESTDALPGPIPIYGSIIDAAIIEDAALYIEFEADEEADDKQDLYEEETFREEEGVKWRYCLPTYRLSVEESVLAPEDRTHVLLMVDGGRRIPLDANEVDRRLNGVYNIVNERMVELAEPYQGGRDGLESHPS